MIEFRTWAEHQHQMTVNPEAMLAQAYRQIAEVGNIYGSNPEVGKRVAALLEHLDELKTLTEAENPLGEEGDGIDHETEGEKPVTQATAHQTRGMGRKPAVIDQKAAAASRRARTRGEPGQHSKNFSKKKTTCLKKILS